MRYALCGVLATTLGVVLSAQTPPPTSGDVRFEVASIKPSAPDAVLPFECKPPTCSTSYYQTFPGRFKGTKMSALSLVAVAYSLPSNRIVGPAWANSERFDVVATNQTLSPELPAGAAAGDISAMRVMLQHLLEDRFALRVHRESKPMSVYVLKRARDDGKLGPQLVSISECTGTSTWLPGFVSCSVLGFPAATARVGRGTWAELRLAQTLSPSVDRPVLDETMLTGSFEMKLEWSDDTSQTEKPSLFTAMREQLGLKLESTERPMEVLVIDNIERPTPN